MPTLNQIKKYVVAAREAGVTQVVISVDDLARLTGQGAISDSSDAIDAALMSVLGVGGSVKRLDSDEYGRVSPHVIRRWCMREMGYTYSEIAAFDRVSAKNASLTVSRINANHALRRLAERVYGEVG